MHQTNKNGFVYSIACNGNGYDRFVRYKKTSCQHSLLPARRNLPAVGTTLQGGQDAVPAR